MSKIGVYGGSFDPIHIGHLVAARDAVEAFGLDRALFVPCAQQPHKSGARLASEADRMAMLTAAVAGEPRFEACDLELRRGGVSYSIDTIRELRGQHPGAELFFIIGADSLLELHSWRQSAELLAACRVATIGRPGVDLGDIGAAEARLPAATLDKLLQDVVPGHMIGISSTEIRARAGRGRSVRYLVPDAVEAYIRERGLYREGARRSDHES